MEILSMINDRYNFSRNVMYLSYKEQVFSSVQSVVQDWSIPEYSPQEDVMFVQTQHPGNLCKARIVYLPWSLRWLFRRLCVV